MKIYSRTITIPSSERPKGHIKFWLFLSHPGYEMNLVFAILLLSCCPLSFASVKNEKNLKGWYDRQQEIQERAWEYEDELENRKNTRQLNNGLYRPRGKRARCMAEWGEENWQSEKTREDNKKERRGNKF